MNSSNFQVPSLTKYALYEIKKLKILNAPFFQPFLPFKFFF